MIGKSNLWSWICLTGCVIQMKVIGDFWDCNSFEDRVNFWGQVTFLRLNYTFLDFGGLYKDLRAFLETGDLFWDHDRGAFLLSRWQFFMVKALPFSWSRFFRASTFKISRILIFRSPTSKRSRSRKSRKPLFYKISKPQ